MKREWKGWWDNLITEGTRTTYTAWDETQANEIGTFFTYKEAEIALKSYSAGLEDQKTQQKIST